MWQFEAIFRISGVWHVGWWNFITSVRLILVGNNRNDNFRYFLGVRVRLIKVSFKVKIGKIVGDNSRQSLAFPVSGMLGGGI